MGVCVTCLILLSLISITSSHKHFEILDVAASLEQARQIISRTTTTTTHQPPPDHSLSLTLISRSSLPSSTTAANYTSLTLSRLARDQAHLRSLLSRLSTHSHLQSPLTSGLNQDSGEYFARIGVGRPAAHLYMVIDTGSDVSWLQCKPCVHCYPQSDPIFDPSASSTYKPLTCLSPQCAALRSSICLVGTCLYQVLYGDASHTIGNFATETISFGSSGSVDNVAIGCGHDNGGLFSGAAGLLGLGGGASSLPAQIKATSFSYCLVDRDSNSSSTLDFNSIPPADSVAAPLVDNPSNDAYRYVAMTGISVGGEAVKFAASLLEMGSDGSGGVIVDSGTTVTRLRRDVYGLVRDAFRNKTSALPWAGDYALFDTCYDLSSLSKARIPTVAFEFGGGKRVVLPPKNCMVAVDSDGKFCLAFAGMSGELSIIGNVQQQGMRVTYDLANKYIAFSPNKC
ncbi:protein ASPARTIC PROTEASE IN GUARD CELL 1-like [Salvia miltiorrhiza]|uniref:protein ASPARTIC PROTEASE IN GUARD CELL 1-like n=1 Tax=Salvia miltiorrhiza TaxID=226208 RepID=UPI0025ABDA2B|nr:protein ASPARTIC PROTEASE IN GUARD CELL 1-like [Salvia miltiorrhiza]